MTTTASARPSPSWPRVAPLWRNGRAAALRVCASVPRAGRLVWQASPMRLMTLVLLMAVDGLLPMAHAWVGKALIDGIVVAVYAGAGVAADTPYRLTGLVVVGLGLAALGVGVGYTAAHFQQTLADTVGHQLNVRLLAKANSLDLSQFDTPTFYDRLRNAQRLGARPAQLVTSGVLGTGRNALVVGSMCGLLWSMHPLLPFLLLAATLPQLLAHLHYGHRSWQLTHWQSSLVRKETYLASVMTDTAYAKEIRVFGLGHHLLQRYREIAAENLRRIWALRGRQRWASTLLALLATAMAAGAHLYIVLQALYGRLTVGDLTLYVAAVGQLQSALATLLGNLGTIYETSLHIDDLFAFLNVPPKLETSGTGRRLSVPLQVGIEFRDVWFAYPRADQGQLPTAAPPAVPSQSFVLRGVSFRIPAGETVALVGGNGAGKTTLVKLLARLYDPTSGVVLLDGVDLREYDVADWHRHLSVDFQDFARYQLAARENIGFGRVEALDDQPRLDRAAGLGGASPIIARLPAGYDTVLAARFGGGTELSGGEWQKIALARAFMRPDAQVLVLDEPTAALDPQAECDLFTRFHALTAGKTTLLISHRLSTAKMADNIVVLEGGRVVEQGSHPDLLAAKGIYARLYELQATRYR